MRHFLKKLADSTIKKQAAAISANEKEKLVEALQREHETLQLIFDACPALIFFKDASNRMLHVNKAFADKVGMPIEAIEGKNCADLFPNQADAYWANDREVISTGNPKLGIIEKLDTDTGTIWLQTDKVPYRNKNGEIIGLIGFSVDITTLKKTQDALKASEKTFATIFREIPDPIGLSSLSAGYFIEINKGFTDAIGYTREEIIGHSSLELNIWENPEDRHRVLGILRAKGSISGLELRLRRKSGEIFTAIFSATLIEIEGETCLLTIARDITARKKAELEREHLTNELSRANKELETLIRVASHDLRSPLVNVQGFNRILGKACDELKQKTDAILAPDEQKLVAASWEKAHKALHFINSSVVKMNTLISGLLRLSRLGREALNLQTVDINMLLQNVLDAMAFQIRQANARILVEPLPDCFGDPGQLNQVFSNLLDNALNYRSPKRLLRIRIWGRREEDKVMYCVEDNGIGVAPEYQDKIWQIFYRLPDAAEKTNGEGLGLTLVQNIIERQNGRVWIESEPDQGSRFFLVLPTAGNKEAAF